MYAKKKEEENQPFDYSRISKPSQFSSLSCIYIFRAPSPCFWSERIFFRYLGPLHSRHGAGRDERKEKYEKLFSAEMQTKARMEKRFRAFFPCRVFDLSQSIWKTLLPSFSAMENSHLCLLQGGEIAQRRQPITMSTEARLEFGATERPFHPTTEAEGEKKQFRNLGPNVWI